MTALLLDTHVALWVVLDSPRLGPSARTALRDRPGEVLVSVASVWEVAIKQSVGKLTVPPTLWDQAESNGLRIIGITRTDAEAVATLPRHHRDPFDRLLVAQAHGLGADLMTSDTRIEQYDVNVVRAER